MEPQHSVVAALADLIEQYRQTYLNLRGEYPQAEADADWPSPCLGVELGDGETGLWQPVAREPSSEQFSQVEEAMSVQLSTEAKLYWNSFYSSNITVDTPVGVVELLQPWNEDDYTRFQQNLVGHLLTQKRFKLPYTVFIGVIYDGEQVIGVDELGAVWLETPGRKHRELLADSLSLFLSQSTPVVLPDA